MHTFEAKKCDVCGQVFDKTVAFCPNDGQRLISVDTLIGQTLDGRYRIEGLLGRGGMGVVYRATHIHLDNQCAIKVLNPDLVSNQSAIERFRREAKAAGRIRHPNAIQVTDFGVSEGNLVYLVMEIVNGPSLRAVLNRETRLDYRRAVKLMTQACAAVEAAHQSRVIHRDLKPDNIVITTEGDAEHVKVLDFGIAKLREREPSPDSGPLTDSGISTLTETGTIIGTPPYMSPEQCRAKKLDPRSDVYSLGVILYEALTGTLPFTAETAIEVVVKHLREAPRPPREIHPAIPEPMERVILRALEKDPANRQASAVALANELLAAASLSERLPHPSAFGQINSIADAPTIDQLKIPTAPPDSAATVVGAMSIETTPAEPRATQPNPVLETHVRPKPVSNAPEPAQRKSSPLGIVVSAAALILLLVVGYFVINRRQTDNSKNSNSNSNNSPVTPPDGMAFIPGGKFLMGRADGERDEGPAHEVAVPSFYLDKYEVTNKDYQAFVAAARRAAPLNWTSNRSYAPEQATLPVTYVGWEDAAAYAVWAGKRLPTEAEWEFAARNGGKSNLYPWGNEWRPGSANVQNTKQPKPLPVGSFETDRNSFGIYDLIGNVSEWVQDDFSGYDGKKSAEKYKVFRGGNFIDEAAQSTATYRWYDYPIPDDVKKLSPVGFTKIGFRCAKDAAVELKK